MARDRDPAAAAAASASGRRADPPRLARGCGAGSGAARGVELPPGEPVLILGEAGCGKTTVALQRLRALRRAGNDRFRAACVVPNEGLRRLIESLLHRLGIPDVETFTWERFASKQARRVFPDLRRRESEGARSSVLRLKRHEALRPALEQLAARPPPEVEREEEALNPTGGGRRGGAVAGK